MNNEMINNSVIELFADEQNNTEEFHWCCCGEHMD